MFTISTSILYVAVKYIKFKGQNNDRVFSEVCTYIRKVTSVVKQFTDIELSSEDVEVCLLLT